MKIMKELNETLRSARQRHPYVKDPRKCVSTWVEKDVQGSEVVDAYVIILRTRGCGWALSSGCSMCGYINDAAQKTVDEDDLLFQFSEAMSRFSNERIVKIYTSGSFFDEGEIPRTVSDRILNDLFEKTEKIIIETRPEFVKEENINGHKKLEVAIGLESANDFVLKHSINKGFLFDDYLRAAKILKKLNIPLKTYLLIKPPFLTEYEAISDAISSAKAVASHSQSLSFNPVNIQKFTMVERLWKNREYRPPWLWSVVEILIKANEIPNVRLISSPTAGGTKKGAHNCGKCDKQILLGIQRFSLTQDKSFLDELNCDCKEDWQDILSTQSFAKTQGDLFNLI
jgi:radical SAM enzyme (TIGR01210 family)